MKSILDPTFRYVSSTQTDLRKTFSRIRREQEKTKADLAAAVAAKIAAAPIDIMREIKKQRKA